MKKKPWLLDALPSGNLWRSYFENGPVEIVDFPMKNGWIFPVRYVKLPEGTSTTSNVNPGLINP